MQIKAFNIPFKFWWLLTGLMIFFCTDVMASNVMSTIARDYQIESLKWFPKLQDIARNLFWKLAAIEFAWSAITWLLKERDTQSLTAALLKKIMSISFFYMLVQQADQWLPMIINGFAKAGGLAANVGALNPSKVLDLGINTSVALLESLKKLSILSDVGPGFVGVIAALLIFLAFLCIAYQMLVTLIESYIVTGAGVLFLGLGGSRWTTDYAQKYIGYAFSIGVRLFTIYLIIGVGTANADKWGNIFLDAEKVDYNHIFYVLAGSLILAGLSWGVPKLAASMLSGAPSLSAGNVTGAAVGVVATAAAAGTMGVAATKAGVNGIGTAIKSGREGFNSIRNVLSNRGSGGSPSGPSPRTQGGGGGHASSKGATAASPSSSHSTHTTSENTQGPSKSSGSTSSGSNSSSSKSHTSDVSKAIASTTSDGSGLRRNFKRPGRRNRGAHIANDEGPGGTPQIRMNHTD